MSRFLCFNNQIQTFKMANPIYDEIIEGSIPSPENAIPQTPYLVKCPWQVRFSTTAKFKVKMVFGKDHDTALKIYQNHPLLHPNVRMNELGLGIGNFQRLFYKNPITNLVGYHPDEVNLSQDRLSQAQGDVIKYSAITQLDETDYSITYDVDMDIEANKSRIKAMPFVVDDFVEDFMNRARFAFPVMTIPTNDYEIICTKFVPKPVAYGTYDNYNNGAHLIFAGDGPVTISQKGTSTTKEEYLIFSDSTQLTDGTQINAGQPYKLGSASIEVQDTTNIVLHIWKS